MRNSRARRRGNGAAQGAETVARLSDLFRGYLFTLLDVEVLVLSSALSASPEPAAEPSLSPVFQPGGGGHLNGSDVSAAADVCRHHPIA